MAREVDLETCAAAWGVGVVVLDVREPAECRPAHVSGVHPAPLSTLAAALPRVPKGRTVSVICASGNRGQWAADRLADAGTDALSVAGGTRGWVGTSRPAVTGPASGSV
ncbi:rhodanese-like domain-containing protein [Streptomyces sp. NPDC059176]|uniref:rhodanese-like domain-containing protein n=1 Tax=unclassified Streptomyces TaxID=2593676 RepID=UPI003677CD59